MGVDWLYRASKTFNRALDKREMELRTPTLLSSSIESVTRTICGDVFKSASFKEGEKLFLVVVQDRLVAQRENKIVAEFPNPRSCDIDRVRSCCIEVAEVKVVNPLSGTIEVSLP